MKINRFTEFSCSIKKIGCCFLLGLVTQSVQSANIMVTATPSGGGCTLNSAILSANADIGISGCTAGDGDDIILIPASLGPHIYTSSLGVVTMLCTTLQQIFSLEAPAIRWNYVGQVLIRQGSSK